MVTTRCATTRSNSTSNSTVCVPRRCWLVLLMYTGFRVSDARVIGPQHRRGDQFTLRLFKNRNVAPVTLTLPIHPILHMVLAWHPVKRMNYLLTDYGKAFSLKGLGNRISDWFTRAGLPHCTAHSVRKGLATTLAEREATDSMLDGFWLERRKNVENLHPPEAAGEARQAGCLPHRLGAKSGTCCHTPIMGWSSSPLHSTKSPASSRACLPRCGRMEASPGIEPGCKDLQSSA